MEKEFSGTIAESVDVTINVSARVKSALSITHFEAAKLFSDMATQIETAESRLPYPQPGLSNLRSFSIAAVIHSVAAAEAKINEMYLHVVDGTLPPMKKLSNEKLEILKEVWADIEKLQMLRKYQIFLSACESNLF